MASRHEKSPGGTVPPGLFLDDPLADDVVARLIKAGHQLFVAYLAVVPYRDDLAGDVDVNVVNAVDLAQLAFYCGDAVITTHIWHFERLFSHEVSFTISTCTQRLSRELNHSHSTSMMRSTRVDRINQQSRVSYNPESILVG